jgi:hypothetical protein
MGKLSRVKGRAWEQEVARIFREWFPAWTNIRRSRQSHKGDEGADVEGTPLWIECKIGKRIDVVAALRQAEEATDGRPVLGIYKRNQITGRPGGPQVFIAMRLEPFLDLMQRAHDVR